MSSDSDYHTNDIVQRDARAISHPYEREALVLLHKAGWSVGELSMTFQAGERAIQRVIQQETGGQQ